MKDRHPRHYKRILIYALALAVALSMGSLSFAQGSNGLVHRTSENKIQSAMQKMSPGLDTLVAKKAQTISEEISDSPVPLAMPTGNTTAGTTLDEDNNVIETVAYPAADFDVTGEHILFVPYQSGAAVMMAETEADGSLNAKVYNVQKNGREYTIDTSGRDRDATVWEFERKSEEQSVYNIFVSGNDAVRYLNIDRQKVTLSDTPQDILVEQDNDGKLRLYSMDGMTIELHAGNIAYGFTATDQAGSTSWFTLGHTREVTVAYTYNQASGDKGDADGIPMTDKSGTTDLDYTIQAPAMESYVSTDGTYDYTYTFSQWLANNGNTYEPGDRVDLSGYGDSPLVLLASWTLTDKKIRGGQYK